MSEELEQLIMRELSKHHSRNELIRTVCEQGGLNWPEAEQLVKKVEQQQGKTIARRQRPFMIFLSFGTLIIGVVLLAYGAEFFIAFFQGDTLEQLRSARSAYYRIAGGVTGLGMVIGGLIGIFRTVLPFLEG